MEVWRPARQRGVKRTTQEPIERLETRIQEAWKPGNLEVWRLGGLGAKEDALLEVCLYNPGSL